MVTFAVWKLKSALAAGAGSAIIVVALYLFVTFGMKVTTAAQTLQPQVCAACEADGYDGPACQRALTDLRASLARQPDNAASLKNLAMCLWSQSFLSREAPEARGRVREEALGLLRRSIAINPADIETKYALTVRTEDPTEKERLLQQILTAQPGHPSAREDLANLKLAQNKFDDALREFMAYLSNTTLNDREQIASAVVFGNSLVEAGRLSDSVKVYEAILDRSKEATRFDQCTAFQSVNLAALSANAGFVMRIRELRAYCSDIEHRNKAAELIRKGLVEDAIQELRLQIKANPKYEEAYVMLAGLYRQTGRKQEAFETLRDYVEEEQNAVIRCRKFKSADWPALGAVDPAFLSKLNTECK
jgi:tetratricopeptide (TPR) repeat protein